jgi:hypothetical protein
MDSNNIYLTQEYEEREKAAEKAQREKEQVSEIPGRPANFPPFPSMTHVLLLNTHVKCGNQFQRDAQPL